MYFKMALKNVKKSFKDYGIYFLTLVFAVCIFYSFNSIESQQALKELSEIQSHYTSGMVRAIYYISVLVSVILGFLIVYANNFLIKRRNKEFGTYRILGMGKAKVSKILILETFIVGIIALILGIIIGIVVSQGFSLLVINLFKVDMSKYSFVISIKAMGKTVIFFGIMFFMAMIFNVRTIAKYKIIDLINMGKKNESIKCNNPIISIIFFVLAIVILAGTYTMMLSIERLNMESKEIPIGIILGVIGTILFYYSISGLIIYIFKNNRRLYFKSLNIFVIKQLSSKVKTNLISISLISIMLFVTILTLSTGINIKISMEANMDNTTPFDASISMNLKGEENEACIKDIMKEINIDNDLGEKFAFFNMYTQDIDMTDYINAYEGKLIFIKKSEYNDSKDIKSEKTLDLKDDEVYILSGNDDVGSKINKFIKDNNGKIRIKGKEFNIKNKEVDKENVSTDAISNVTFTVIINDKYLKDAKAVSSEVNIQYNDDKREDSEKKYVEIFKELDEAYINKGIPVSGFTKISENSRKVGIIGIMIIVLIYIGLIFLLTSMAVLSLKQLSEASDSMERYRALKRMGVNIKRINNCIFKQVIIFFAMPVILALSHSIVGIILIKDSFSWLGGSNLLTSMIVTLIVFLIIYLSYFLVTYGEYKNIVRSKI